MTKLAVSEAAKNAADFLQPMDSRFGREYVEQTIQLAMNSELDRLAGPLVEALEWVAMSLEVHNKKKDSDCGYNFDASRLTINEALATYRKERGE